MAIKPASPTKLSRPSAPPQAPILMRPICVRVLVLVSMLLAACLAIFAPWPMEASLQPIFAYKAQENWWAALLLTIVAILIIRTMCNEVSDKDIWKAARAGEHKRIKNLLREGMDANAKQMALPSSPLCIAAAAGHSKVCEVLIAGGAEIEYAELQGGTALCIAASAGHTNVVRFLLSKGANINATFKNDTPECLARRNGHVACEKILRDVTKVSTPKKVDIWKAARAGDAKRLGVLLADGANPNVQHPSLRPSAPLSLAAAEGHESCVVKLLNAGAKIEHVELQGDRQGTALCIAAAAGHLKIVSMLLDKGANPSFKLGFDTPADLARQKGHSDCVKMLQAALKAKP